MSLQLKRTLQCNRPPLQMYCITTRIPINVYSNGTNILPITNIPKEKAALFAIVSLYLGQNDKLVLSFLFLQAAAAERRRLTS
jgi:hypothetical protein